MTCYSSDTTSIRQSGVRNAKAIRERYVADLVAYRTINAQVLKGGGYNGLIVNKIQIS